MSRRCVMGVALVGVLVGGAGAAFADTGDSGTRRPQHELCLLLSQDPDHSSTQDLCVTWPGPVRRS
jgi:hypothetical protein